MSKKKETASNEKAREAQTEITQTPHSRTDCRLSRQKKTAGAATPNGQQKNNSNNIIVLPLDVVNMSDEEIIDAAVKRLQDQDKEAKFDRYGAVLHAPVREALSDFCRQNAEFARAICESDKHFCDCLKFISKEITNAISDIDAYTRAVQFYFSGATVHFKMLIDVGDGVLNEGESAKSAKPEKSLEISLDNLMDW